MRRITTWLVSLALAINLQAAYETELAAVAALGNLTTAPAIYDADQLSPTYNMPITWAAVKAAAVSSGSAQPIFYDGRTYKGNPTRVYAWVGLPADLSGPVPAVVLAHGGLGTAFKAWVDQWTARGYAAIAMDLEGRMSNPDGTKIKKVNAYPGPARDGYYADSGVTPLSDQWMYHAVADTILANSLMRSLPEVNASKVGLMGISWGGVIASTVIGIDDRFAFAIPTYGCGHMYDARTHWGTELGDDEVYKKVWDPMVRIANATMPVLWLSWPQDPHFPMENLAYTYHGAPGPRMVSIVPGMGHNHPKAYERPESYDFADSIVASGTAWCEQQSISIAGNTATVVFRSSKPLHSASLVYRTSNRPIVITGDVTSEKPDPWTVTALSAPVESPAGTWTVTTTLPAGVTGWMVNVKAQGIPGNPYGYVDTNLIASSEYREEIALILSPGGGLEISHPPAQSQSTGTMKVAFTGPGNVEIIDIQINNQSHPGAFTHSATLPLIIDYPTPTSAAVQIRFDNTVAGLTTRQTATGTVTVTLENLDGSTKQTTLPISATVPAPPPVVYDATADWSSKTVVPSNDVIIRNGATVALDSPLSSNVTVYDITVNDEDSPTTASLDIHQNVSLTATSSIRLGAGTGAGFINQSGGMVTTPSLTIHASATGDASRYNLSGGSLDIGGLFRVLAPGELKVIGNGSQIGCDQIDATSDGKVRFVFGETGVTTLNVDGSMSLGNVSIVVDGSAYVGGEAVFVLMDSTDFLELLQTDKLSIIGFDGQSKDTYFIQNQAEGTDWVQLVVENRLANGVTKQWMRSHGLADTDAAALVDSDGDGMLNWQEFVAGTNPVDGNSALAVSSMEKSGNQVTIRWKAVAGKTYTIECRSDLKSGDWTPLQTGIAGVEPENSATVTMSGNAGFIRVKTE